jgi:hypothetical protein
MNALSVFVGVQERDQFERIHLETFGRSGCRRTVAGQYIAADPGGRAVMVAAIEKQRVFYTFDRDSSSLISISAPLEAPRAGGIIVHTLTCAHMRAWPPQPCGLSGRNILSTHTHASKRSSKHARKHVQQDAANAEQATIQASRWYNDVKERDYPLTLVSRQQSPSQ